MLSPLHLTENPTGGDGDYYTIIPTSSSLEAEPGSTTSSWATTSSLLPVAPAPRPSELVLPAEDMCVIMFAHGVGGCKSVRFKKSEIRSPPSSRFRGGMQGIVDINAQWDDDPRHWGGNSYIHLDGTLVPMFYWHGIYANRVPAIWSTLKSQWNKYKVSHSSTLLGPQNSRQWFAHHQMVVEYYRRSSPQAFEARFSDSDAGHLMGLNQIASQI